jgi:hypothetical protein
MFNYSKLYKLGQLFIVFVLIACQQKTDHSNDVFPPEITNHSVTPNPNNTPITQTAAPSFTPTLLTQTVTPTTPQYPQKKAVLYEDFNKIYLSNFIDEDKLIA